MCADGRVHEHQILDGRHGIDVHAVHLFGELTVGIAECSASGKRLCLRPTRVDGGDAKADNADAAAVPLGRRLTRADRADGEREHEHGESDGFYNVHRYSSFSIVPIRISQMKDKTR